ncbi:MAG: 8-amino-7-oxononanoate synthase [Pseudohongiella sp.]|nr:8-amino-7-oxononanoate synthase [Pseudohongiella sp.]
MITSGNDIPRWRSALQPALESRRTLGLIRQRQVRQGPCLPAMSLNDRSLISFCTNDYLGLSNHPDVLAAFIDGAREYGVGSGASHMVTGHCSVHDQLEEALAVFTGRDRALLFSTGYMANLGVINALTNAQSLVLQDELNHASLLDGGWLSRATSRRYPHANLSALEQALRDAHPVPTLIVTDGVFSMDGDVAPLPGMIALARRYGAGLMVDDAHGMGCLGLGGQGVIANNNDDTLIKQSDIPVLIGTFGKAFGTAGAFVAGDEGLIDYLEQFTRTYTFTTAMPPALARATLASLKIITTEPWRRQRLQTLINTFRSGMAALKLPLLPSDTPVQALMLGDVDRALAASQFLLSRGLQVSAIRPPTVPAGSARLRITLSAVHTDAQLQRLLDVMAELAHTFSRSEMGDLNVIN